MESSLSEFIAGLEVREPARAGGVTVYPLFNRGKVGPSYTLLADALARDVASVEEKGGGSVPVLVLINKSETPVLVSQGDELAGGLGSWWWTVGTRRTLPRALGSRPGSRPSKPRGSWSPG